MKLKFLMIILIVFTIAANAQDDVVTVSCGSMADRPRSYIDDVLSGMKSSVKIPCIDNATFFLYNYDYKKDLDYVKNSQTLYRQDLKHQMRQVDWVISLVENDVWYAYFIQGTPPKYKDDPNSCPNCRWGHHPLSSSVKYHIYDFKKVTYTANKLVPMAIVIDSESKLPKELINRICSKDNLENISLEDIRKAVQLTKYFSIIAYNVMIWKE